MKNVLTKLNAARKAFHASKLTKTGENKFAGYKYFELSDFLVPALNLFEAQKLAAVVSFGVDVATMTITDLESGEQVLITSPMSTASLKACHEVQNLGAVQTYLRRYLWVAALEIVEHDAIDSSEGAEPKKKAGGMTPGNIADWIAYITESTSIDEARARTAEAKNAAGEVQDITAAAEFIKAGKKRAEALKVAA